MHTAPNTFSHVSQSSASNFNKERKLASRQEPQNQVQKTFKKQARQKHPPCFQPSIGRKLIEPNILTLFDIHTKSNGLKSAGKKLARNSKFVTVAAPILGSKICTPRIASERKFQAWLPLGFHFGTSKLGPPFGQISCCGTVCQQILMR